ncbi:hypothetical protein E2C01_093878 [Portunus trituberculatus]|uniref:Uncharacterized protein n=1 Tax=Portunus trituberculatus TaxID=210409 RepID=A0A5B7JVE6_PORTR|nr:hypothetical protein [Portunus trituberculatus]
MEEHLPLSESCMSPLKTTSGGAIPCCCRASHFPPGTKPWKHGQVMGSSSGTSAKVRKEQPKVWRQHWGGTDGEAAWVWHQH